MKYWCGGSQKAEKQRGAKAEQSAKTLTLKSRFIEEERLISEMTILSSELYF